MTSLQFSLQWNSAVLQYVGTGDYGLSQLGSGNFDTASSNQGQIAISWEDPNAEGVTLPDGSTIFSLQLKAVGSNGSSSPVSFSGTPLSQQVAVNFILVSFNSQSGTVTIEKPKPIITWSNPAAITYGTALALGSQLNAVAYTPDGTTVLTGDYTYNPSAGAILGASNNQTLSVTFTPSDTANYDTATKTVTVTVNPATLTVRPDDKQRTYAAANPALTFSYSGFVNGESASVLSGSPSLSTAATQSSGVSDYPITVSQGTLTAANYTFSMANGTLTVSPAVLTVTAEDKSRSYGGANPTFTASYSGFVNGESSSVLTGTAALTTTATAGSSVGNYPISASAGTLSAANYTFSFSNGTLTVTPVPLVVSADNKSRSYGAANPVLTASYNGFVNGDTTTVLSGSASLSTSAGPSSGLGTYPITASAGSLSAANYTFSFANGSLTVSPALLTVSADNKTRIYGAANPALTFSYSGFVNGESASVLSGSPSLSTTATQSSGVGDYPITVSQGTLNAANYTFNLANGTLTVSPAVLTVTAEDKSRSYGGANPTFTASYTGFVNGESSSVLTGTPALSTVAAAGSPVGNYPISASAGTLNAANYTFNFTNGTLAVTPVPLVASADNKSRSYGAANPVLTVSYSGFVNGDTAAVLSGSASLSTAAGPTSGLGTYPITASAGTLSTANYTFTFANGTLTVSPALLTVSADNKTRVYGAANPALTFSYSGFVNGESASVLSGSPSLSTTATQSSGVGDYPITVSQGTLSAANYTFSMANGTLTVSPAVLTVTAEDKARNYGGANPTFTANYSGFVNGESSSVLTGTPALTTTATAGSSVGNYPIAASAGTLNGANYTFNFRNGTLAVTPVGLVVSGLQASNKVYDGTTTATLTGVPVASGVIGSDAVVLAGTATGAFSDGDVGTNKIVTISGLSLNGADAGNYILGRLTLTASIIPATLIMAGVALDGYIANGLVFFDINKDRRHDTNEPSTTTDSRGGFTLDVDLGLYDTNHNGQLDAVEGTLVISGGTDIATGLLLKIPMRAPPGSKVINPLTTLLVITTMDKTNADQSMQQVEEELKSKLGIPPEVKLTNYDALAAAQTNDANSSAMLKASAKVQDTILGVTSLLHGLSNKDNSEIAREVTRVLANQLLSNSVELSSSNGIMSIISQSADALGSVVNNNVKQGAARVIAEANEAVDDIFGSGGSSLAIATNITRIEGVAQDKIATSLSEAGAGTVLIDSVITKFTGVALRNAISNQPIGNITGLVRPILAGAHSQGQFKLILNGETNRGYVVQTSTTLLDWTDLTTVTTATNGVAYYIDSAAATVKQRFYRARLSQ